MESIARAAAVYFFLLLVFRISGHRALSRITGFDLLLLLLISQAIQHALLGNDNSMTNAGLIVLTLVALHTGLAALKRHWKSAARTLDGVPLVLVSDGRILPEQLDRAQVAEHEILEAARASHGLDELDQVRYAVLERTGKISIIPRSQGRLRNA